MSIDDDFRYGQLAVESRLVTPEQFDAAMTMSKKDGVSISQVMVKEGFIDDQTADRVSKALQRIIRDERAVSESGALAHKLIGGYKSLRRVGEGGMGEVYLAEQLNMHRLVALKVLHSQWADDEEFRKRFLLEARAAGKLSHQNLIQVYDVGKYQGKYYFAMEYVDGVTVEDMIEDEGILPIEKVIDISLQVCSALSYLDKNDIVHRDIKPANMMVTKESVVKLGDFGFIQSAYDAELLQEGTTLGTPDYISPEQARGERGLDVRSDLYSLGASMYHMLAGKTLYKGSCSQVMRDHINTEAPDISQLRDDVPAELLRVLNKMLCKDPSERFQTADEMINLLELLKIDQAGDSGELPATRSQIMHVITAEKQRIKELEQALQQFNARFWLVVAAGVLGWICALIIYIVA